MGSSTAWQSAQLRYALPVEEARTTLRVSLQVAHEAFQDGLFTAEELEHTVGELRSEYEAALEALGVDAASLPDPSTDKPPPPRPASRADTYRGGAGFERAGSSSGASTSGGWSAARKTESRQSYGGAGAPGRVWQERRASTPVQHQQEAEPRMQSHTMWGHISPPGSERASRRRADSSAPSSRAASPRRGESLFMFTDTAPSSSRAAHLAPPGTPPPGETSLRSQLSTMTASSGSSSGGDTHRSLSVPQATSEHLAALAAAESAGLVAPGSHAIASNATAATARQLADADVGRMAAEAALHDALEQLEHERAATAREAADVAMLREMLDEQNDALAAALDQVTWLKARVSALEAAARGPTADAGEGSAAAPASPRGPPQAAPEEWELPPTDLQKATMSTPSLPASSRRRGSRTTTPGSSNAMSRRHVLAAEVQRAEEEDALTNSGGSDREQQQHSPQSSPASDASSSSSAGGNTAAGRKVTSGASKKASLEKQTSSAAAAASAGGQAAVSGAAAVAPSPPGAVAANASAAPQAGKPSRASTPPSDPEPAGGCFAGIFGRKRARK